MITFPLDLVLLTQLDSHLTKYLIFNSRYNKIYLFFKKHQYTNASE